MPKFQQLLKSKTLWASLATICTGIGLYVSGEQQLEELMVVIVGAVFGVLRFMTDTSLGSK